MAVGGKGYRTRPTIWQPIWRISELKKSRQTSGNIRCQISWDKRKHTPVFARPARFPQHCVCARLNSGYTLQLCAGLSLPSHYLRHECYPRITHWPETGQKLLPKALSAFSVSEILIINCCFPIISSFRTASGYKGGWADGRKRSTDPQAFQSYQGWAPESHCSRMGAVHLAALHTSGFLLWTWGLTSASAFLSLLPGLRTAASVIALMLSSSKGKWSLSVLRNSFTAQVGSL